MIKAVPAAALGGCLLLILLLAHTILHELSIALQISAKIDRLAAGQVEPTPSDTATWAKLFSLATEAQDVDTFITRLKESGLSPDVDKATLGASLRHSQELSAAAPAQAIHARSQENHDTAEPMDEGTGVDHRAAYPGLTKELAASRAQANTVFVTWTNHHFVDFVQNWISHLQEIGVTNYLVGAMGPEAADALAASGVPFFAMFTHAANGSAITIGSTDLGWGSERFHQMGRLKVDLLRTFLGFGLDVVLCDSDTVWLRDPRAYLSRFPAADMLLSSDHLTPTPGPGDEGLEQPQVAHSAMNIGVMFVRATEPSRAFVDAWVDVLRNDSQTWDQNAFNKLARDGLSLDARHEGNDRLFYGWQGRIVLGVLPVATFASGHTFHVQHAYELQQLEPYVVHQTFQYGGTKGKRHRLREAQLWADPPEYYSGDGPFIHAVLAQLPAPPEFDSLRDVTVMSDFHLRNMEFQLLQLRDLFAMAVTLNRTVVLPKLMCYCDRYWGPVDACRVPGALKTRLPFVCPLDHILEPFHLDDNPAAFGPPIRFKEHSFLDNPKVPGAIRNDVLELEVHSEDKHPSDGSTPGSLTAKTAQQAFSRLKQQVLQLRYSPSQDEGPQRFLQEPLADAALQQGFTARISHMPAFWCCRMGVAGDGTTKPLGAPYAPMMLGTGIELK